MASRSNIFEYLEDLPEELNECSSKATNVCVSSDEEAEEIRHPLVWIDLEMTGLDLNTHTILQIAVLITDGQLQRTIEGPELVVHQPEEVLEGMNEWCVEHHGKSGLTEAVRASALSMRDAELQVLEFVRAHVPYKKGVVAGNSVHVDIAFLKRDMPELAEYFHYRIVDVSTIMELSVRWFPSARNKMPKKKQRHTAMSDIKESLEELKYWRRAVFKTPQIRL
mmetsp:Transcript_33603/g.63179  ORF Transcript_33603/g.63179 Transcript_33603/m.63179 type:complete len:223 (-) Transcript_33603:157-825(-)